MIRFSYSFLFVALLSVVRCIGFFEKENTRFELTNADYGYFKFKTSLYDGNLSIRTKIFQDPNKCYSDYDCHPTDLITESGFLTPSRQSLPIALNTGSYYAISQVSYGEGSFQNCKSSDLKIYHGFQFKEPFDPFHPLEFYLKDSCKWIDENKAICPPLQISKKGVLELELSRGKIRSSHYSLLHWVGPSVLFPFVFFYCGPVSEYFDFVDLKIYSYEN
ncbi:hypothetical protein JWG40_02220 [Leptospira sp. 201903074]|uniref:hypothetical protein n=1 Tax=Leptospira abararensis TaxID=2810036 RepID=UPI001962C69D|nr:hypothetical protein [Leptospira abararensis]MBM9545816.1 hypothetical protein [Leptospira abararensis]